MWFLLTAIPAVGAGAYFGIPKLIKWWNAPEVAHPITNTPVTPASPIGGLATLPSNNPSGGTFVNPAAPPVTIPIVGTPTTVSGGPAVVIGTTPGGNTISGLVTIYAGNDASTAGQHLFDFLKAGGPDGSAQYHGLVSAYQAATAKDIDHTSFGEYIAQNGIYDLGTSAALSFLMGDPIPPDTQGMAFSTVAPVAQWPDTPAKKRDTLLDTNSTASANNLFFFLRKYGHKVGDPKEMVFVKQFQHDVNVSPMFKSKGMTLTEDGKWGPATQKALAVYGLIPPS